MFAKHAQDKDLRAQSPQSPQSQTSATPQKNPPTVISADLAIKGTLRTERDVRLDGRVEGDVRVAGLVLCEQALVIGNVYADEVVIRGRVEGNIRAAKVQLTATAHVAGDIMHDCQLSIEPGAFFVGKCRRSEQAQRPVQRHLVAVAAE